MPYMLSPRVKSGIRRASRRLGYEIVPFGVGFAELQGRLLSDVDLALDVGANVGQYAEKLRDLGYARDIVSFEPGSEAFSALKARSFADSRWLVRECALSDHVGEVVLHVSENSVSSSLLPVQEEHLAADSSVRAIRSESVSASTIDAQVAELPGDKLWLKLDVQGHEIDVLRGATATLERTMVVQAELSFGELYAGQSSWLALCEMLLVSGFVLRHFEPGYQDRTTGYLQQADGLFVRRSHVSPHP